MERRTISALNKDGSILFSPTEIIIKSAIWEGDYLFIHAQNLELWRDQELEFSDIPHRRVIHGYSLEHGIAAAKVQCAYVTVASGPQDGKTGFLIWANTGGIAVSGLGPGLARGLFAPSIDSFPMKAREVIQGISEIE